jgi:hypothetical protein
MWYFLIIGFLILGFLFGSKLISKNTGEKSIAKNYAIPINSPLNENDTIKAMFSKKQIDEKLKHLAETPAPPNLSFGAMCYEIVAVYNSIHEYKTGTGNSKQETVNLILDTLTIND